MRGAVNPAKMTQWQRDELLQKEAVKQKNQAEIQVIQI